MSYSIAAQFYQFDTSTFFHLVERAVWTDGFWSEVNGTQVLTMGSSGTSGSLRFQTDSGEGLVVTLGINNGSRWGDIAANLGDGSTCVQISPQYYDGTQPDRIAARNAERINYSVFNNRNRNLTYAYIVASGSSLKVNIITGVGESHS